MLKLGMSLYCAGGSDAAKTRSKICCTIYDLITELVPTVRIK